MALFTIQCTPSKCATVPTDTAVTSQGRRSDAEQRRRASHGPAGRHSGRRDALYLWRPRVGEGRGGAGGGAGLRVSSPRWGRVGGGDCLCVANTVLELWQWPLCMRCCCSRVPTFKAWVVGICENAGAVFTATLTRKLLWSSRSFTVGYRLNNL